MDAVDAHANETIESSEWETLSALETDAREAFAVLTSMAEGRVEPLPAELLARQVLEVTQGADWPVQRAAMQALLRRAAFAERDDLRVKSRPPGRRLGLYTTARRGARRDERPYQTMLMSVGPPRGSCNCPDFLRSSLGLCKHLLVVLADLYAGQRKLAAACTEQMRQPLRPRIAWTPVRPLTGAGDWLAGVYFDGARSGGLHPRLHALFDAASGALRTTHADNPQRRMRLVAELAAAARRDGRDPALMALLDRERAALERRLRDEPLSRQLRSRGLHRKLYPFQLEGVRRLLSTGRLLLADDMGLGKTTQAVAACHVLYASGRVRRGLAIVPASLKSQWLREWQQTSDAPVAIVDGSASDRAAQYQGLERGFLIMNYEQLLRDLPLVHAIEPDIVVLDEAQRIKNWETKTAAYVKSLRVAYRLVLTGTPMENRLDEIASIFDWVDDLALEPKWRLAPWHTWLDGDADRGRIGARNLDTLRQRMAPCMLRRVRREVLAQLPARTDTRVPVDMTPQQRAAHAELDLPIARLLGIARKRPLTQAEFLRLMSLLSTQRMICNGLAQVDFEQVWPTYSRQQPGERLLERLFSPKLFELRRLVSDIVLAQERKVVIFSQWRRMLRLAGWAISDLLAGAGLRAVFFTGAESQKQRTRSVVELHDDPRTRVMLLSDAGGVGLNLQRAATCCINLELPWNPAVLEQRIGRIHRIGQCEPIDVYNLVSEEGIEARIATLVSHKQALFTGLFDGSSNEVRFEGASSFVSELERLIEAATLPETLDDDADRTDPPHESADDIVAGADESSDEPGRAAMSDGNGAPNGRPPHSASDFRSLLDSLAVRRTESGGIAIEAPPEAAAALATLFGKMTEMLAAASQ